MSDDFAPTIADLGEPQADVPAPMATRPFNPERTRETMRGALAAWSFGLFSVVVLGLLLAVILGWRTWDELQGITTSLLPVVVSVLGATTGFYFGTQDRGPKK